MEIDRRRFLAGTASALGAAALPLRALKKSLDVDIARGDDVIVAYAMNGSPLPRGRSAGDGFSDDPDHPHAPAIVRDERYRRGDAEGRRAGVARHRVRRRQRDQARRGVDRRRRDVARGTQPAAQGWNPSGYLRNAIETYKVTVG